MKTEVNKLVRDKIPRLLPGKYELRVLSNDEYLSELVNKLTEELSEYEESNDIMELVDILEVVFALSKATGTAKDELENLRAKKLEEKGGFANKYFLAWTEK